VSTGFLSYADATYRPLAQVLLDSMQVFSEHPIELMRWEDLRSSGWEKLNCFSKFRAYLRSPFDHTVWVDADCVANRHVDALIEFARRYDAPVPLLCYHGEPQVLLEERQYLHVKTRTMPYGHACVVVFNRKCSDFFKECLDTFPADPEEIEEGMPPLNDESVTNVMLWKYDCGAQLNCVATPRWLFPYYAGLAKVPKGGRRWLVDGRASHHLFHGEKDPAAARGMLSKLLDMSFPPNLFCMRYL